MSDEANIIISLTPLELNIISIGAGIVSLLNHGEINLNYSSIENTKFIKKSLENLDEAMDKDCSPLHILLSKLKTIQTIHNPTYSDLSILS